MPDPLATQDDALTALELVLERTYLGELDVADQLLETIRDLGRGLS